MKQFQQAILLFILTGFALSFIAQVPGIPNNIDGKSSEKAKQERLERKEKAKTRKEQKKRSDRTNFG